MYTDMKKFQYATNDVTNSHLIKKFNWKLNLKFIIYLNIILFTMLNTRNV